MRIKKKILVTSLSAVMCASLASSLLCLDLDKTKNVTADVPVGSYALSDLISLDGASFSAASSQLGFVGQRGAGQAGTINNHFLYGNIIQAEAPYSGAINATFTGSSALQFKFPKLGATSEDFSDANSTGKSWGDNATAKEKGSGDGHFEFTFSSIDTPENYFTVEFAPCNGNNAGNSQIIKSGDETNAFLAYGLTKKKEATSETRLARNVANILFSNPTQLHNRIQLKYVDVDYTQATPTGTIEVYYASAGWASTTKLMTLNASDYDFANGYKISFASEYETGTEFAFKSVLGKTLADGSATGAGGWYDNNEFAFTSLDATADISSATLPEGYTSVITYKGEPISVGTTLEIPRYDSLSGFKMGYQSDSMFLSGGGAVTPDATIDTTAAVGTTGTVAFNGVSYNYEIVEGELPTITVEGDVPTGGETGTAITLPSATSTAGNVSLSVKLGETPITLDGNTFTPVTEGAYSVVYSVTDANGLTATESFTIEVFDSTRVASLSDLLKLNGATLSDVKRIGNKKVVANDIGQTDNFSYGRVVEADGAYSGEIVPVFTKDFSVAYKFPDPTMTEDDSYGNAPNGYWDSSTGDGNFKFTFTDVNDENHYVTVEFAPENPQGNDAQYQPVLYVGYSQDGVWARAYRNIFGSAGFNNTSSQHNLLELTWDEEGNLWVTRSGSRFSENLQYIVNLGKVSFPNGYKVSFSSALGTEVAFKSILGKSLRSVDAPLEVAKDVKDTAWQANTEFTFTTNESQTIPLSASKVLTYNGRTLANGENVVLTKDAPIDCFKAAFNYNGMLLVGETVAPVTTPDVSTVGATGDISFNFGGQTYTYTYTVMGSGTVAYDVNGTITQETVTFGDTILLPAAPAAPENKVFVGWLDKADSTSIYKANAAYAVTGSVVFQAAFVELKMLNGASIRTEAPYGIRFISEINTADYELLEDVIVRMGTLVITGEVLNTYAGTRNTDPNKYTFENMNQTVLGMTSVTANIIRKNFLTDSGKGILGDNVREGYSYFSANIVDMQAGNYARKFGARTYMTVDYADGSSQNFYTAYHDDNNMRSVYDLAKTFVTDYPDVQTYIDSVADITLTALTADGATKAYDGATYTLGDVSFTDNEATTDVANDMVGSITVNGNVGSVMFNGVLLKAAKATDTTSVTINGVVYNVTNVAATEYEEGVGRTITFVIVPKA